MKKWIVLLLTLLMLLPACALAEVNGADHSDADGIYTVTDDEVTISGPDKQIVLEGNGKLTLILNSVNIEVSDSSPAPQAAGINLRGFNQVTIRLKGRNYVKGAVSGVGILSDCPLFFEDENGGRLSVDGGIYAKSMTMRGGGVTAVGDAYGISVESLQILGGNLHASCRDENGRAVAGRMEYAENVIVESRNQVGDWSIKLVGNNAECSARIVEAYEVGSAWNIELTGPSGELKADKNTLFTLPGGSYTLSGTANRPVMIKGSGKLYLTLDNVEVDLGNRHTPALPSALRIYGYDEVTIKFVGENNICGDVGVRISCKTTIKGEPGAKLVTTSTNEESFHVTGDLILDGGEIKANGFCDVFAVKGENSNITVKKGVIHAVATGEDSNPFYIENDSGTIMIEDGKIDVESDGPVSLGSLSGGMVIIKGGALFVRNKEGRAVMNPIQYDDGVVVEGRNSDSESWQLIEKGDTYDGKQVRAKGPTSFTEVVEDETELGDKQIGKPTLQMNMGQNPDVGEIDVRVEEREYPEDTESPYMKWYEVELLDEIGNPVEIRGTAKLYIPYPAGYGPQDTHIEYEIRHIKKNGDHEIFSTKNGKIQRKPYGLQIEIDSFSPFEIDWTGSGSTSDVGAGVGGKLELSGDLPGTGDPSSLMLWLGLLAACGAAALTLRRRDA